MKAKEIKIGDCLSYQDRQFKRVANPFIQLKTIREEFGKQFRKQQVQATPLEQQVKELRKIIRRLQKQMKARKQN